MIGPSSTAAEILTYLRSLRSEDNITGRHGSGLSPKMRSA